MNTKIICTIGPASNNPEILDKLENRGVDFFRINLSHTDISEIEKIIISLRQHSVPIILDTEGSQVRSGNLTEISLKEGDNIRIYGKSIKCGSNCLFLNPPEVIDHLREGDIIFIDFNSVLLKVTDTSSLLKGYISCKVLIHGNIGGRKAVYIDSPTFKLPPFSKKDLKAVELAKKYKINHFTLSFMESSKDVVWFRKNYPGVKVFSKIESRKGLDNFIKIARASDGVLIDRGDLSSQVPLEKIPLIQKYILRKVRQMGKQAFVATNTLEQMSLSLKPNRAEVNDIINTLLDGATGIALTKETAVGKYPVETVNMLISLINQVKSLNPRKGVINQLESMNYLSTNNPQGLLIKPHGGNLINRMVNNPKEIVIPSRKILIDEETLMDIEQIAIGSFSPLQGFLCREDFRSVVDRMTLSNGTIWPIPIVLMVSKEDVKGIHIGESIGLSFGKDNQVYAILHLEDVFKIDKHLEVKKIYGTDDLSHPGVKSFMTKGDILLGGKITLIKRRDSPHKVYELTPRQTRRIFYERGWSKILGFHTRNVIHRSHEFIQLEGLKKSFCDGLFIHPIIGKKKDGDFDAKTIISTYELMMEKFYPPSKTVLCSFASYPRYAGPREALFTALVRKNFGCSHFIVGRDHTGVGNFYKPDDSHKIFDKFNPKDLGIIPIKFGNVFYSKTQKSYLHEPDYPNHSPDKKMNISGTQARNLLKLGKAPPKWFMRPEISSLILDQINNGERVFVDSNG
jgi:pyruvate kinase